MEIWTLDLNVYLDTSQPTGEATFGLIQNMLEILFTVSARLGRV